MRCLCRLGWFLLTCSLSLLTTSCGACGGRSSSKPKTSQNSDAKYFSDLLGGNVNYDASGIASVGSTDPISRPADLNCAEFSASGRPFCRWHNEATSADRLDWIRGVGSWDAHQGFLVFGTRERPSGAWAITGSRRQLAPEASAMLVSDVIRCQGENSAIAFRYWTTPNTVVRVCARRPNDGARYFFCSGDFFEGEPGPATVIVPGPIDRPFQLVIEARRFTFDQFGVEGGAVAIDDIRFDAFDVTRCDSSAAVSSTPAPRPLTTAPPPTEFDADAETCRRIACSFDTGNCLGELRSNEWTVATGESGNIHTGIRKEIRGAYGLAQGPAIARMLRLAGPLVVRERRGVGFCHYRATAATALLLHAVTRGSRRELYRTRPLTVDPHEWICNEVTIPPGTYDYLEFSAENLRNKHSYLGLDSIRFVDGDSGRTLC